MKNRNITIELLKHQELSLYQKFIKKNYSAKHIFAQDHSIFDWQHKGTSAYFCMSAKQDGKLIGTHGFIPQSHFDVSLPSNQIFLALWIADEEEGIGIGLQCYKEIIKEFNPEFIGSLGITPSAIPFHKWQEFKVGLMEHHVVLSPTIKKFEIAIVPSKLIKKIHIKSKTTFKRISANELRSLETKHLYSYQLPRKSDTYIINRFMNHPVYDYEVYAIKKGELTMALCVLRPIKEGGATVLRFVDFIGQSKAIVLLVDFILSIIEEHNAEYLDLYSFGIPSRLLIKAGFIKRESLEGLIIPNYFEPFEQKNVNIVFAYKSNRSFPMVRLFKADADQDRPNYML